MVEAGNWITLNTDNWNDVNKEYFVHAVQYSDNNSSVILDLRDSNGKNFTTVIASHQILKVKNSP